MELLKLLHDEDNITIVIVSHLLNVVINYAEEFVLIDGGVRMVGRTDEVLTSKNLSDIYEIPVEVAVCKGKKVILTGGKYA